MNRQMKKVLGITLGITIIILLATFVVFRLRANYFVGIWDKFTKLEPEEGDISVFGIGFLALIVSLVGVTILTLAYPTIITAVLLAIFFVIILCVKKETTQRIVVLVLLPFAIICTIVTLLGEAALFLVYWIALSQAFNSVLSVAILALLVLSAACLISCVITIIVSCIKLTSYCNKVEKELHSTAQQAISTK